MAVLFLFKKKFRMHSDETLSPTKRVRKKASPGKRDEGRALLVLFSSLVGVGVLTAGIQVQLKTLL